MDHLSERIQRLSESKTLAMARMSRELKQKGIDIIDLNLGEPDFPTPEHIVAAANAAMKEGFTKYPPVAGFPELREAICSKFKRDNQLDYLPEQIVVSTGAKQSLINVMLVLLNPGDEVIVPAPYWVSYPEMIQLAEGKMVSVYAGVEQDYKITAAQLEAAITPKTKLFVFSSPCNPTGSVYLREELAALAEIFAKHPEITILSDEIYEHINFNPPHVSLAQFPKIKNQVVVVNGFSKSFAMTGWRLGYIAAPAWIAKACDKMQGQITSGANSITQRAAISALNGTMEPTKKMCAAFNRRLDLILKLLAAIPGIKVNKPTGAFYVFPDVSFYFGKKSGTKKIDNADELALYLLNEAHVSVVSGEGFGDPSCVRISYATADEKISEGIRRIAEALSKLI